MGLSPGTKTPAGSFFFCLFRFDQSIHLAGLMLVGTFFSLSIKVTNTMCLAPAQNSSEDHPTIPLTLASKVTPTPHPLHREDHADQDQCAFKVAPAPGSQPFPLSGSLCQRESPSRAAAGFGDASPCTRVPVQVLADLAASPGASPVFSAHVQQ